MVVSKASPLLKEIKFAKNFLFGLFINPHMLHSLSYVRRKVHWLPIRGRISKRRNLTPAQELENKQI
jgi:hypothetical protein